MALYMTFDQVRRTLPHAYPMLLIDVVEELVPGESIVCRKNVTGNEWMVTGHFPERAIYPGVLLIEGMAQSGILLVKESGLTGGASGSYLLAGTKVRFLEPVVPGDQIRFSCTVIKLVSTAGIFAVTATVAGKTVAKGELTFAFRAEAAEPA